MLVIRDPRRPAAEREDRARLEELRRLISMLGVRLRVEEGEDAAAVAIRVARGAGQHLRADRHAARSRSGLARLGSGGDRSLLMRLLRGLPGVDVRDRRRPDAARISPAQQAGADPRDAEAGDSQSAPPAAVKPPAGGPSGACAMQGH